MVSINRPSLYLLLLNCLIGFSSLSIHSLGQSICHSISLFHLSVHPAVVCPFICHYVVSFICQSVSMSYMFYISLICHLRLSVCVCQSIYLFFVIYI